MSATNASAGTIEKSRSNGSTTSTSMPQAAIELGAALDRGHQPWLAPGREHLARMPIEGHRDAAHVARSRLGAHPIEDGLMPPVDPVEEAHRGDARSIVERERVEPVSDVHRDGGYRTESVHRGARITSGLAFAPSSRYTPISRPSGS